MISKETNGRYYLSWRGQVVLVAREQMRFASATEAAATQVIQRDMNLTLQREDRIYRDVADPAAEPKIRPRVKKDFLKKKPKDRPIYRRVDVKALKAVDAEREEQREIEAPEKEPSVRSWSRSPPEMTDRVAI